MPPKRPAQKIGVTKRNPFTKLLFCTVGYCVYGWRTVGCHWQDLKQRPPKSEEARPCFFALFNLPRKEHQSLCKLPLLLFFVVGVSEHARGWVALTKHEYLGLVWESLCLVPLF